MSAPSDIQKILDRLSGNAPLPSQQHPQYGYGYKGFESPAVPPPPIPEQKASTTVKPSEPSNPPNEASAPARDPSTITTWRDGHRYVARHLVNRKGFEERVQEMIAKENKEMKRLSDQRVKLEKENRDRLEGGQKVEDILRSLNVPSTIQGDSDNATRAENATRLRNFDLQACRRMRDLQANAMFVLHDLGVPFFAIQSKLVLDEGEEHRDGKVAKKELVELRRKMARHLLELFAEDEEEA